MRIGSLIKELGTKRVCNICQRGIVKMKEGSNDDTKSMTPSLQMIVNSHRGKVSFYDLRRDFTHFQNV